jgi:phosphoribosyl 1,2-cyclic phosphodiesterase
MEFKAYHSSSKGNLYRVSNGDCHILLEAGVSIKEVRRSLYSDGLMLKDISACLITHEHRDHAFCADKLLKAWVDVYASMGTAAALKLNCKTLELHQTCTIGAFKIKPFRTDHDAAEPFGYLISDGEDLLIFTVDAYDITYNTPNLTMVAIECNYADDLIDKESVHLNRIIRNHMSLERVKAFLLRQDLSKVREIHLLHLSSKNSDENRFIDEITELTGKQVFIGRE